MLVTAIGLLVTNRPELGQGPLGLVEDAALVVDAGRVVWVGSREGIPEAAGEQRIDAGGRCVIPGFVDAHTHLVFAGDRAREFEQRLEGVPYAAGGIRSTVAATRAAGREALERRARHLAEEALTSGTTTLEVKSGYGLDVATERRLLEVAAALEQPGLPRVSPTYLGAHVVPPEYDGGTDAYVELVTGEMLDACAPLATWCDVFCEQGAFDAEQARAVLVAASGRGLGARLHANQLGHGPGAQLAAEVRAVSADHLTHLTDDDVTALADAGVVATLLPAAELSTRSPPAPARSLIDAGATIALATDCNPGTSFTTSMPLVVALGALHLGLTAAEALTAATVGGARALRRPDLGHLGVGAAADLVVLDAPSYVHLAYRPGMTQIRTVVRGGRVAHSQPGAR